MENINKITTTIPFENLRAQYLGDDEIFFQAFGGGRWNNVNVDTTDKEDSVNTKIESFFANNPGYKVDGKNAYLGDYTAAKISDWNTYLTTLSEDFEESGRLMQIPYKDGRLAYVSNVENGNIDFYLYDSGEIGHLNTTTGFTFNDMEEWLNVDSIPTSGSTNYVTSGGVYQAIVDAETAEFGIATEEEVQEIIDNYTE